jgi:hypothetical protein
VSDPALVEQAIEDRASATGLLLGWGMGDRSALERLIPIIYDDLLQLARARLQRERGGCTLQPTALVHESYLRLADQTHSKSRAGRISMPWRRAL